MITEDYVSFETAKLLKEKGFQQLQDNCGYFTTEMIYSINVDDNGEHHFAHQYPAGVYNKDKYIAAPTLQMAMKWLREKKQIFITIMFCDYPALEKSEWIPEVCTHDTIFDEPSVIAYPTYEEACEATIKYCLENLI